MEANCGVSSNVQVGCIGKAVNNYQKGSARDSGMLLTNFREKMSSRISVGLSVSRQTNEARPENELRAASEETVADKLSENVAQMSESYLDIYELWKRGPRNTLVDFDFE
jgi:hypothetical protein